MSSVRPPELAISFEELPDDPNERHEVLVDIFGRYVFWMRNWSVEATRQLGESEEVRARLAGMRREKYDKLATLSNDEREIAYEMAQATTDRFIQMLLTMMAGTGVDHRLGSNHAVRFKLDLEICDVETIDVVESETINRGGSKFFADYWGRWLNRFRRC